jgi:ATP-dependent DNA helicase RecQ
MDQLGYTILKDKFGYSELRPSQIPVIESILARHDTVGIMPTGGGKSLCFQLPALMKEGLTVVVSPLIALMHDQVESLKENGIWAEYLNSSLEDKTKDLVMEAIETNNPYNHEQEKLQLLYISPEKLFANDNYILNYLKNIQVSLFAIDEAHCISSWGHDFRPEYANLGVLKTELPNVPIIALTATADEVTRKDIVDKLKLVNPNVYVSSFDRPNITYTVEGKKDGFQQLFNFITARKGQAGIVYCLSRKSTEELAERLNRNNIKAACYHASLSKDTKDKAYDDFMKDKIQVVCATIAFGMGIDKPNVRFVVHWNLPKSIEGYYQETGRAGRDGLPSEALLLYNVGDVFTLKGFIDKGQEDNPYLTKKNIEEFRRMQHDKLNRLLEFCKTGHCRRRILLQYFNEKLELDCGNCDSCLHPKSKIDATIIAQKIISTIFKTNQRFGSTYITDILVGSKDQRIINNGHDKISTYGIGKDMSKLIWVFYINQLIDLGYVNINYDGFIKTLALDQSSYDLIKSGETLELVEYKDNKPEKPVKSKASTTTDLSPLQSQLFEGLKNLRKSIAEEQNVPPYIIFGDVSLIEMVQKLPINQEQFSTITGVGKLKLDNFGPLFTRTITQFCDDNPDLEPSLGHVPMSVKSNVKTDTISNTKELLNKGMTYQAIAKSRKLSESTIIQHMIKLYENDEVSDTIINNQKNIKLNSYIEEEKSNGVNYVMLSQWKTYLEHKYAEVIDYNELRIALL